MPSTLDRLKLRWRRKRLLWRAFRSRHALTPVADRTGRLPRDAVLAFVVLRNEADRLPYFLAYYKSLGVTHFLCVDNASDDGSAAALADDPQVSLWQTKASYRAARFGMDWLGWLQMRHARGRWCLTVDVDELLVYDGIDRYGLHDLTKWLDDRGHRAFGALMLDMAPDQRPEDAIYQPGDDPIVTLPWFEPGPFRTVRQEPMQNLWVQGGLRERAFFSDRPHRSPTLNKLPLVRWSRGQVYVNSTHAMLPARLNHAYDGPGGRRPGGVLLHTKFLPGVARRSLTEKRRREHFTRPEDFDTYYDQIAANPVLRGPNALRYVGPDSLITAGIMPRIDWTPRKT